MSETKNMHRFVEVTDDPTPINLYLRKSMVDDNPLPENLIITIAVKR